MDLAYQADAEFVGSPRYERLKREMTPAYWMREMERQANALGGARIYPEFEVGIHVIQHKSIPHRGCLYMALDPHPRTPHGMLWLLIDGWSDWYVYRELWDSVIYGVPGRLRDDDQDNHYTTKEYTEAVAWVEGNYVEWRHALTDQEYGIYRMNPGGEKIVNRFMDQAGKGFVVSEHGQETYSTRYNKFGLQFVDPKKDHQAGEDAVHSLLKLRQHEIHGAWPRLHISDECPELILELQNHRYKVQKRVNEEKDLHQRASEFRCHLVDCLRYIATSNATFIPSLESRRRAHLPSTLSEQSLTLPA